MSLSYRIEIGYRKFCYTFLDRIQRLRGCLQDCLPSVVPLPLSSELIEDQRLTPLFEQIEFASNVRQEHFACRQLSCLSPRRACLGA